MKNLLPIMLVLLGMPLFSFAQDNKELETDRPTETQGPSVVPQGTLQIESGFEFRKDNIPLGDQKEYLYPNTVIRIGIFRNAELRINADLKKERTELANGMLGEEERGFANVTVGTKINVYQGSGAVPQMGILGSVTLPVGHNAFRPPHAAPEGRLLFSNKLSDKLELQYNVGYRKRRDQDEYRGESLYAVTGNLKLSDKVTYFAEVFGQKPNNDTAEHMADTGFMFKLLPNLQLDVIGALGLNDEAPDYFLGGGVTWRIPQ